jgi:malate dehydrogenase
MNNAKGIDPSRFSAMTRLDHNRAVAQTAQKLGVTVADVTRMTIWGNHSATQFPDLHHALVNGKNAYEAVGDQAWYEKEFIPTVQQRGAAVIKARGLSSAASAANAAIDHMHDWVLGTADGDWVSMAVCADGSYGADEGLISGYPVTTKNGEWSIVQGLEFDEFSRARIDATIAELRDERDAVRELGLIG